MCQVEAGRQECRPHRDFCIAVGIFELVNLMYFEHFAV
jgi:hypothetical protein